MPIDYKDYAVLYVDDEHANLLAIQYALEDSFSIEITTSPQEAAQRLQNESFAVLLADQRMPGMTGIELCEIARRVSPDTTRIIMTAYADVHAAIDAVNRGQVMRYLRKPLTNEMLVEVLKTAIELTHATESIRELRSRVLTTGTAAASQSATQDIARLLEPSLRDLQRVLAYGDDLVKVLNRTEDAKRAADLRDELGRTFQDATGLAEDLDALRTQLALGQTPAAKADVDLSRIVSNTVRLLKEQLGADVDVQVVLSAAPSLSIEPATAAQILTHLLLNAAEAVRDVEDPTVRVELLTRDGAAVVLVSDNGPGVPEHVRERIFDPQFSTRPGAAGLGLSVARRLTELANGKLELERSEQGAGFSVRFPIERWDDESGEILKRGTS